MFGFRTDLSFEGERAVKWNELDKEACSLTRTLSVIGDRWTILILRDCFLRVRRFEDFQERLGIGRGILADRLRQLTDAFILTKVAYQQKPTRYEYRLTAKGKDLYPVVMAMVHWGDVHMAGRKGVPIVHHHRACGEIFHPILGCSHCGEEVHPRDVDVLPGPGAGSSRHLPLGGHGRRSAHELALAEAASAPRRRSI